MATIRTAWAFFIDVPNIGAGRLPWNALAHRLMGLPEQDGTIIHKRAYFQGKPKRNQGFKTAHGILNKHGFDSYVSKPTHGFYPDVDAKIMHDMSEIRKMLSGGVYVFPKVNIVLLSSDGDFAEELRLFDKEQTRVYVFGKTTMSRKLTRAAHVSSTISNFLPNKNLMLKRA